MEITSLNFILLFILSVIIYYLITDSYRIVFLSILSCLFIGTHSINLLLYVLAYTIVNFIIGIALPNSKYKKALFRIGIVISLSQLILLKYISSTIDPILSITLKLSLISELIIPVGISFFTLQGIGYLINIKMGWERPERNFIHFLVYIAFFPRFLSGPIDRSNHFLPQLKTKQLFIEQNLIQGLRLVLFGLFKKVVIANQLATVVSSAYLNMASPNDFPLWVVLLVQPLYLYFDFSGYSDIAIGIARTFGIVLRPNFNRPFFSENMTAFWKRFHISLSSWFHDYIFLRSVYRYRKYGLNGSVIALFFTWIIFGIWHGAGWSFMLLGMLQGTVIYYEYRTKRWRIKLFSNIPRILGKWIGRFLTYLFFSISLVFFFAEDINSAFGTLSRLFQNHFVLPADIRIEGFALTLAILTMVFETIKNDYGSVYNRIESFWYSNKIGMRPFRWAVYFVLISMVIVLNNDFQQFIYFQF